jgi:hypothetical protein
MQHIVYGAESAKFFLLPICWQDLFVTSFQPIRDVSRNRAKNFWKGYSPLLYPPLHNTLSSARTLWRNYVQLDKKILVVKRKVHYLIHKSVPLYFAVPSVFTFTPNYSKMASLAEVKIEWSCTSALPCDFAACVWTRLILTSLLP